MTNSRRLTHVRERLRLWLSQQPYAQSDQAQVGWSESMLVCDGFYCGRRFNAGAFYAVWFMEEHELKIHTAEGELLSVFKSDEIAVHNESSDVLAMPEVEQRSDRSDDEEREFRRAA